jgi:hypothetical protein
VAPRDRRPRPDGFAPLSSPVLLVLLVLLALLAFRSPGRRHYRHFGGTKGRSLFPVRRSPVHPVLSVLHDPLSIHPATPSLTPPNDHVQSKERRRGTHYAES